MRPLGGLGLGRAGQIHDQELADALHRGGSGALADLLQAGVARVAIVTQDANLDQFVRCQGALNLGGNRVGETGLSDDHHGVEVVGKGLERLAFGRVEGQRERGSLFHRAILDPIGTLLEGARVEFGRSTAWTKTGNMGKKKFNKAWVERHINDPYVKQAQQRGYRSRGAFKLLEIDERDELIRPGILVVDLGSTPGAWCQVLRERMSTGAGTFRGRIVALDMLPMEPVADVEFLLGDFREAEVLGQLEQTLGGARVDLIVSDMAPNLSGVAAADAARMSDLIELALEFARDHLKPDGALLAKCFHGSGYSQVVKSFKQSFAEVGTRKPKASRDESAETYLLGRRLKPSQDAAM